ncbi:MAG: gamma-glutamyl-phosphate reductase, partial [Clostridia bacterium]|nr:gamma-glutamyl-phosphate reductase [Clostridia bacterium]
MTTLEMLKSAKECAGGAVIDTEQKNKAIELMARAIEAAADDILAANEADVADAADKLSASMIDRLKLTRERILGMTEGMRQVAALPDPVGRTLSEVRRDNGLLIEKKSCPIGVLAIIYESRPNVTSDAAVLCFKSSNVCVLKPGRDSYRSAEAIVAAMREGLKAAGADERFINLVPDP